MGDEAGWGLKRHVGRFQWTKSAVPDTMERRRSACRLAPSFHAPSGDTTLMKGTDTKRRLSPEHREGLIETLKSRFEAHGQRHPGMAWAEVEARLAVAPETLWTLQEMERTGGEPDVIGRDEASGACVFFDCSAESPEGRRSVCYDREGLESRKEHRPKDSAVEMAAAMGIELLTEEEYRQLQQLGEFDLKTSSWVKTPPELRKLGGALFGDRRFGRVFIYHNGAQSYYGARGFRGVLRV